MQAQVPQAHQWESLSRNRNIIRVCIEIQPGDLSNRHLGVKNSNADTSEFLTLYPSLNIGGFLSIFSRFRAIPASLVVPLFGIVYVTRLIRRRL